MIEDFDKVWDKFEIYNWDEYQDILKKFSIQDNSEIRELFKSFCKVLYGLGFSDGHADASHNYYKYRETITEKVSNFFKDIMLIEREL